MRTIGPQTHIFQKLVYSQTINKFSYWREFLKIDSNSLIFKRWPVFPFHRLKRDFSQFLRLINFDQFGFPTYSLHYIHIFPHWLNKQIPYTRFKAFAFISLSSFFSFFCSFDSFLIATKENFIWFFFVFGSNSFINCWNNQRFHNNILYFSIYINMKCFY